MKCRSNKTFHCRLPHEDIRRAIAMTMTMMRRLIQVYPLILLNNLDDHRAASGRQHRRR